MNTSTTQGKGSAASIPGLFMAYVDKYVDDQGGDRCAPYFAAGLDPESFKPQQDTVSEDQFYAFIKEATRQTNATRFGAEVGQTFSLGSFGLVSKAIMSCANLGEALTFIERYSVLVMPLIRLSSQQDDTHLIVELDLASKYPDLNRILMEALIACSRKILSSITAQKIEPAEVSCTFTEPPYLKEIAPLFPAATTFGARSNSFRIDLRSLNLPFITANPIDAKLALAECEAELIRDQQPSSFREKVSNQIRYYLDTEQSEKKIAAHLNMSERNLRRKLAEEEATYRELLQEVRREMACYYLHHTHLQIAQIALKLGYQETSNFRAAFKRWTGISPRAWREQHR